MKTRDSTLESAVTNKQLHQEIANYSFENANILKIFNTEEGQNYTVRNLRVYPLHNRIFSILKHLLTINNAYKIKCLLLQRKHQLQSSDVQYVCECVLCVMV